MAEVVNVLAVAMAMAMAAVPREAAEAPTDAAEEMHEAMASAVEGDGARWARAPCAGGGGPCRFFVVATS